jgi:voltage-gated potassium channel
VSPGGHEDVRVDRLERYENRTSAPLTGLAGVFLLAYGVPVVWPHLPPAASAACAAANGAVWAVFAADLAVRLVLTHHRARFLATHVLDVLAVVLPVLRPLRVLRVFAATQTLLTRSGGLLRRGQAIVITAGLLVLIAALAELDAERGAPGGNIRGFSDALWWALTTVTTVGYGDHYPVTGTGRIVAAGLMVVGISLVGSITATVAAWFVAQRQEAEQAAERDSADVQALTGEVAALRAEVARLTGALSGALTGDGELVPARPGARPGESGNPVAASAVDRELP